MATTTESNGSLTRSQTQPESVFDGIDRLAVEAMNEIPIAGLALGVVREGELVHELYHGAADIETGRQVDGDTIFRIGSISKTFTGIGLMRLVEAGLVDLDEPANRYLKSIRLRGPAGAAPITVRHLLTHRSGLGELRGFRDLLGGMKTVARLASPAGTAPADLTEYYAEGLRAAIAPEDRWAYANHAFGLLGQLIADVSGQPFAEYQRENVLLPIGMTNSDYMRTDRVKEHLAIGYAMKRGRLKPVRDVDVVPAGAGSIFSSIRDMSHYIRWLSDPQLQASSGVLRPETLAQMRRPQFEVVPGGPAMGLAFWVYEEGDQRVFGHDGGWLGFVSTLLVAPEARTGVICFTNTSALLPAHLGPKAFRKVINVPEPGETLAARQVAPRTETWGDLVGVYAPDRGFNANLRVWLGLGGELEVLEQDGHLALRTLIGPLRKGGRLVPIDAGDPLLFEVEIDKLVSRVRFRRDASGAVTHLAGPGFQVFRKRSALRSGRTWGKAAVGVAAGAVALKLIAARRRARRS